MGFGEDFSLKFACSGVRDREWWSINSEAQWKLELPKIFEDIDFLQDVDHSPLNLMLLPYLLKSKLVVLLFT